MDETKSGHEKPHWLVVRKMCLGFFILLTTHEGRSFVCAARVTLAL